MGRNPARSSSPQGDITKITGHLPTMDVEIIHHEGEDDGHGGREDRMVITVRAQPGFDAVAQALLPTFAAMGRAHLPLGFNPLSVLVGGASAMPFAGFAMLEGPFSADNGQSDATGLPMWSAIMEQAWAPWLTLWQQSFANWRGAFEAVSHPDSPRG